MGLCMSKPRRRDDRLYDDYYDPDENWYHGDQSWQFFRAEDMNEIYDSEFQPEPPKRKTTVGSAIRSKIQSLRNSFFNQGSSLEMTPKVQRRDSKGGIKSKFASWRRSWFGPEPSPSPQRKLSLSQTLFGSKEEPIMRREKKQYNSLSKSGQNRLSVTRSFVEKHGQPDDVYKKASKSPSPQKAVMENESSTEREENTSSGQNIETQAMIATRRPPLQNQQIDIEDEISECKIHNRNAEREFLAKIKEIGSMDYYSDSDEDVSQLNRALQESPKGNRKELNAKHATMNVRINGDTDKSITKPCEDRITAETEKGEDNICNEDLLHEEEKEATKEDLDDKKIDGKLQEGLALFNENYPSEDEEEYEGEHPITCEESSVNSTSNGEVVDDNDRAIRRQRRFEDQPIASDDEEEEEEEGGKEEPKRRPISTKSTVSVNSVARTSPGSRIQISSKGRS